MKVLRHFFFLFNIICVKITNDGEIMKKNATLKDYMDYSCYLEDLPLSITKYIYTPSMQRLDGKTVLCGMEYASKHMYDIGFSSSRLDHSINVAKITWCLTHDKKETLCALFHDISTPVFSHVIDYLHDDTVNQEYTESSIRDVLINDEEIMRYLAQDGIGINEVCNPKMYSIVDNKRPSLCADRLENIISVGMSWAHTIDASDAMNIIDDMHIVKNEDGFEEVGFYDEKVAYIVYITNIAINNLTHSSKDRYMMYIAKEMVKTTINLGLVSEKDLLLLSEKDFLQIIYDNLGMDESLANLYGIYKYGRIVELLPRCNIKNLTLNPICLGNRIN